MRGLCNNYVPDVPVHFKLAKQMLYKGTILILTIRYTSKFHDKAVFYNHAHELTRNKTKYKPDIRGIIDEYTKKTHKTITTFSIRSYVF